MDTRQVKSEPCDTISGLIREMRRRASNSHHRQRKIEPIVLVGFADNLEDLVSQAVKRLREQTVTKE